MSQPNLPDEDHFVRYVPWQRVRKDADDNVIGILGEAFRRREIDGGLSVNWLERANPDPQRQLAATVAIFLSTMTVGKKARVAVANVGRFKAICSEHGTRVRVVHAPEPDNEPHSEIRQLPRDDIELLEILAVDAVLEHFRCHDLVDC